MNDTPLTRVVGVLTKGRDLAETVFLLVLLAVSAIFIFESRDLSAAAATLPRFAAYGIIFIAAVLLLKQFVPERIVGLLGLAEKTTRDPSEIVEDSRESDLGRTDGDPAEEATREDASRTTPFPTLLLTSLYFGLVVLVGLHWATIVFVLGYGRWADQPLHVSVILTGVGIAVITGFSVFVNPPSAGIYADAINEVLGGLIDGP